jgi:hypothetical protein
LPALRFEEAEQEIVDVCGERGVRGSGLRSGVVPDGRCAERGLRMSLRGPAAEETLEQLIFNHSRKKAQKCAKSTSIIDLFADEVEYHFAAMGGDAVFPEVNALPGAKGEVSVGKGDAEVHGGEGGADVGGHVVVAFSGVDE